MQRGLGVSLSGLSFFPAGFVPVFSQRTAKDVSSAREDAPRKSDHVRDVALYADARPFQELAFLFFFFAPFSLYFLSSPPSLYFFLSLPHVVPASFGRTRRTDLLLFANGRSFDNSGPIITGERAGARRRGNRWK